MTATFNQCGIFDTGNLPFEVANGFSVWNNKSPVAALPVNEPHANGNNNGPASKRQRIARF